MRPSRSSILGGCAVAALALLSARPATAQEVTVGGVGYAQYAYALSDTANQANAFSVTRAYINVVGNLGAGL